MRIGIPFEFGNAYTTEVMIYDKNGLLLMYSEDVEKKYPLSLKDIEHKTEVTNDGNYQIVGYILPTHPQKIFYIQDLELEVRDYAHTRLHLWHVMIDYEYKK